MSVLSTIHYQKTMKVLFSPIAGHKNRCETEADSVAGQDSGYKTQDTRLQLNMQITNVKNQVSPLPSITCNSQLKASVTNKSQELLRCGLFHLVNV